MIILSLINAINAKEYVTLVPERVHVSITYRLLLYVHEMAIIDYIKERQCMQLFTCVHYLLQNTGYFWASGSHKLA